MDKSPTQMLANFAADTTFSNLPKDAVHATKRLILDTVGCAIGGYGTEIGKKCIKLKRDLGGTPESTILVVGDRTSCTSASFVNAQLANALDADEIFINSAHFANCVVMPALAVAERVKATGRDLLLSVAVGFDVAARIGLSLDVYELTEDGHFYLSEFAGMSWATFAAAIAAGKLLGLDGDRLAHAIGIAGYSSPIPTVTRQGVYSRHRPMVKYAFYGVMAEAGVSAALLAQMGFTGDQRFLDGERGFWKLVGSKKCDWDAMTGELGKIWYISQTSYKPYPACRYINTSLDLFLKIMRDHRLSPEEVESVTVRFHGAGASYVHADELVMPDNEVDAQFSVPYLVAVAALGDKPGPSWQSPAKWKDPRVMEFARKVKVEVEPTAFEVIKAQLQKERRFKRTPASADVIARGQKFSAREDYPKGDPWTDESRMTDEELKEKFRNMSYQFLCKAHIEKAIDLIYNLEQVDSTSKLVSCLI